jgi:hypothetical protein
MDKKQSFDSEEMNSSFDCEIDEVETKEQTHRNEKEEEFMLNKLPNTELIKAISQALTTILEENRNNPNYKEIVINQKKMPFSSDSIPGISIEDYLIRIQTYANTEKNTLIVSLIFIDRLCQIADLTLTYYNIHRILFTSVLLSVKYNEDNFYDNKFYAEIAGVKLKELNILEYTFAQMINFRFFINNEIFEKYEKNLNNYEN